MKNYLIKIPLLVLIITSMSSCVSTNKGFQSAPVMSRNVDLDPIKADIEINAKEKVRGESTAVYFLRFRISGDNTYADGMKFSAESNASIYDQLNPFKMITSSRLGPVRGAAAYKALSSGDYDILVHPNYTVTVKNYLIIKKYTASVTGYGAKYKNFRTEKLN
jgi:hypothetical protein